VVVAGAGLMSPPLQILKGQGLALRWFGFEAESGLAWETVDQCGPVLDALEPRFFMMAASWSGVLQPPLLVTGGSSMRRT
jgi:hypothetical protein